MLESRSLFGRLKQISATGAGSIYHKRSNNNYQVATALLVAGSTLNFGYLDRLLLHPPAHIQASFKALGCLHNCMQLTCGSFQLTHIT